VRSRIANGQRSGRGKREQLAETTDALKGPATQSAARDKSIDEANRTESSLAGHALADCLAAKAIVESSNRNFAIDDDVIQ
jgi:hypothetical protein